MKNRGDSHDEGSFESSPVFGSLVEESSAEARIRPESADTALRRWKAFPAIKLGACPQNAGAGARLTSELLQEFSVTSEGRPAGRHALWCFFTASNATLSRGLGGLINL